MNDISLSERAHEDLEEIDDFTAHAWGETQCSRYMSALFKQFDAIAASPGIGMARRDLGDGIHALPCLVHVIFYATNVGGCIVLRVLHQRREPELAFNTIGRPPLRVREPLATYGVAVHC